MRRLRVDAQAEGRRLLRVLLLGFEQVPADARDNWHALTLFRDFSVIREGGISLTVARCLSEIAWTMGWRASGLARPC